MMTIASNQAAIPCIASAVAAKSSALPDRMQVSDVLFLSQGDLTQATTDAIVNAANPAMLGGGGVDGAIHRAAGPGLLSACRAIPAVDGVRCPPGHAQLTPGFELKARWVIHSVGPIYQSEEASGPVLAEAYRSCLSVAREHGLTSLAFPAISCGVYGYPHADAAEIALQTCLAEGHNLHEIRFVLFSEAMYKVWAEVATRLVASGPLSPLME